MKEKLLDIFATTMTGLICLIGIGLLIVLLVITFIGCFKFPMIVIPIVVLLLSYAIGNEALKN